MEAVSVLVDVSNSSLNVSRGHEVADFNAVLIAEFRLVERTLFALQRNLDDFYFVTLTAITFGKNEHAVLRDDWRP